MAKEFARAFYGSKAWHQCRDSYIAKRRAIDGGLCEVCRESLGYIVHHEITLTPENIRDPDTALNHRLLSYECKACHDRHEGHGVGTGGADAVCVFDERGDVTGLRPPFRDARG